MLDLQGQEHAADAEVERVHRGVADEEQGQQAATGGGLVGSGVQVGGGGGGKGHIALQENCPGGVGPGMAEYR
ncbi:hypothetical protein GCM10010193_33790 [Kitasatospora atroaurantiaca]